MGPVLCTSGLYLLDSSSTTPPRDNQECLQTLPNIPGGQNPPQVRSTALKINNFHNHLSEKQGKAMALEHRARNKKKITSFFLYHTNFLNEPKWGTFKRYRREYNE